MEIDKPIATALILFVTLILVIYFLVPKYQQFQTTRIELGKIESEFNAKYAYYSEVSRLFRELEIREEAIEKIESAIPEESSYGNLIYFLQKKSAETGLIIKTMTLSKVASPNPNTDIKEIVLSFNLLGAYPALKNFLDSLEKSARLFETTSISFSSLGGPEQLSQPQTQPTYNFNLEIKTHSY